MPRRSRATIVATLALLVLTAVDPPLAAEQTAAAARRPMVLEDMWAVQRVGRPVVAPNGRRAAFTVTSYSMDDNKGQGDLWLVDIASDAAPRRLTWNKGPDSSPAWSPDGDRMAYVSKRGDDPAQVFVLSLSGGEPRAVTELPVAASDPVWLPNGREIAFLASTWPDLGADFTAVKKRLDENKNDKTKAYSGDSRLFRYWDHYVTDGQTTHVFVVDVGTGKVRDVMPGASMQWDLSDAAGTWDVSPDGTEIVFSANTTAPPHQSLDYDLWVVPAAGGTPRRITEGNRADDVRPRYTPDGRSILFGRGRRPEIDADFTRLARYDRKTGAIVGLTDDWDAQPSDWTTTADGRTILFHAQDRGRTLLYSLGIGGGTPTALVRDANTGNVAAAAGDRIVFTRDSITAPAELWTARLTHRQGAATGAHALTAFNRDWAAGLDLGSVRDVTFTGAGGDAVQMFVVLPPGYESGRRYPLLHVIHGGPHGASLDQFHYRWNAALLASRGHVAALVNFHGSTGFGQSFCESIVGAHGDKPFADIMASCDWLIAEGLVDPERMAASGASYGGYLVDWILGHTDRFKALVSHGGVYDLMGQFASDATWGRPASYGSAPWQDPARIDLWSPSRFAANFKTPTLVLHGEKDFRVPVTQGINLYGVLTAKGVPARIVVFPDENHWILKPQASRLWHRELFAWVEKYVGAGPTSGAGTSAADGSEARAPGDRSR